MDDADLNKLSLDSDESNQKSDQTKLKIGDFFGWSERLFVDALEF